MICLSNILNESAAAVGQINKLISQNIVPIHQTRLSSPLATARIWDDDATVTVSLSDWERLFSAHFERTFVSCLLPCFDWDDECQFHWEMTAVARKRQQIESLNCHKIQRLHNFNFIPRNSQGFPPKNAQNSFIQADFFSLPSKSTRFCH